MFFSKKTNAHLYNIIISRTVSYKYLHLLLISLEYIFCIFPYVISSRKKIIIHNNNNKYKNTSIEQALQIIDKVKSSFISNKTDYTSPYLLILIILLGIGLISYFLMYYLYTKTYFFKWVESIFVNFYNIILFRYFSIFFLDVLSYYFLSLLLVNKSYTKTLISYVVFFILIIYIILMKQFIANYSIYLIITNDKIIAKKISYPFDSFSAKYEQYLIPFKLVVCFSSNYLYLNDNQINNFEYFLNIMTILLCIFMFLHTMLENVFVKINLVTLYTNKVINYCRKIIIVLNFFLIILTIFFNNAEDEFLQIIEIVMGCITTYLYIFLLWNYLEKPKIVKKALNNIEEIIVYFISKQLLLVDEPNQNSDKKHSNTDDDYYKHILRNLFSLHSLNCKVTSGCIICDRDKINSTSVYEKMYYLYKEHLVKTGVGKKRNFNYYLIKLFFSKIKNKSFAFFKYYSILMNMSESPLILKNTLHFFLSYLLIDENYGTHVFFYEIIKLNSLNLEIKKILKRFEYFFNLNFNLKTADILLSIAKNLDSITKNVLNIILGLNFRNQMINANQIKDENLEKKEHNRKVIQSVIRYNLTLSRYILETLMNKQFKELNPLNIELLDDYLNYHYRADKIIVLSISINGNDDNKIETISITGFSSKEKCDFLDYFPKELAKDGEKKLLLSIQEFKEGKNKTFDFIIERRLYLEYIHFNFELSNILFNEKMLIFGDYTSNYDKILLLDFEEINTKVTNDIGNVKLVNFSRYIGALFLINPFYILLLKKFGLGYIFLKTLIKSMKLRQTTNNDTTSKGTYQSYSEIICELNYEYLYNNICPIIEKLKTSYLSKDERDLLEKYFEKTKEVFNKKGSKTYNFVLIKLFDINKKYSLYKLHFQVSDKSTMDISNKASFIRKMNIINQDMMSNDFQEIDDNDKELYHEDFYQTITVLTVSNSSITEQSISEKLSSSNFSSTKVSKDVTKANDIIKKETKKLSIASLISLLLNISLILLCLIFLVTQITQTSELRSVNTLFFEFKTLRNCFGNTFLSILSQICVVPSPDETQCVNNIEKYLEYFQNKVLNFSDYKIADYLFYEAQVKIDMLKGYYSTIQDTLYSYDYNSFVSLLESDVTYYSFEQKPDQLVLIKDTKTYENSMKSFFNTIILILQEQNEEANYKKIPIYIVTLEESGINFENIKNQNLSNLQLELYKLLANFINFSLAYNNGENIISQRFQSLRNNNSLLTWGFIIVLIAFNVILEIINIKNLQIANMLFKKIIFNSFSRIDNKNFKEYFNKKIENLIDLSELYSKKPDTLIKNIASSQVKFNRAVAKSINSNTNGNSSEHSYQTKSTENEGENFVNSVKNSSFQLKIFSKETIFPLYLKSILFFMIYFIVIVIIDIILVSNFNKVFDYHDFGIKMLNLEGNLYNDLTLSYLTRVLNITDATLAKILGKKIDTDGVVNLYIRDTLRFYTSANKMTVDKGFKKLADYVTGSCDIFYSELNDPTFYNFHEKYNLIDENSLYKLQKIMCKKMIFMNFDRVQFIYEEYLLYIQSFHNRYTSNTYSELYRYISDYDVYHALMYQFFYLRPAMKYYSSQILTPEIMTKFSNYLVIVWVYLVLNIVFETSLFFSINISL